MADIPQQIFFIEEIEFFLHFFTQNQIKRVLLKQNVLFSFKFLVLLTQISYLCVII